MPMLDVCLDDLPLQESFEVVLDGYGFTGEAYVRLGDGWLSVRGALPKERVRVQLEYSSLHTRRWFATLLEVLEPSRWRQDPLCPKALVCRGCHVRHMTVEEERRFKSDAVVQVLFRFAGLIPEDLPPVEVVAHEPMMRGDSERIRSSMTYTRLEDGFDGFELGLIVPGATHLMPMDDCPALDVQVRRLIVSVRCALEKTQARGLLPSSQVLERVRVASAVHGHGLVELVVGSLDVDECVDALLKELDVLLPECVAVFLKSGQDDFDHVRGPKRMRLPLGHATIFVGPQDWFHATLRPANALYKKLLEWLELVPSDRLLDVGCGVGTISLLSAPYVLETVGIDRNLESVRTAEYNAQVLGLAQCSFSPGSWENALRRLNQVGNRFDVATINPMREPLGKKPLAYINRLVARRLIYLGPSPASAARDIGELVALGWKVSHLATAILHPATYHTMLVAVLVRT